MIEAQNLKIGYKNAVIADGINACLQKGELTALLGLNGVGKSTLMRTLCGMQPPLAGAVTVNSRPLASLSRSEMATLVSIALTEKNNASGLTVRETVALGRFPYTGFFGRLNSNDILAVNNALVTVGIEHKADCFMTELSDGERQKAILARTLAQQCDVIILDEPTAFLDVTGKFEIMTLLHDLAHNSNIAVLISTHDLDFALRLADKLWLMSKSPQNLTIGTPQDLVRSGAIDACFNRGTQTLAAVLNPASG
jgi:iron complex transport system ATP-binding protein